MTHEYLEMHGITKVYPNGVVANDHAELTVARGEIHAIAGENGAGKSTIMKVLYGAERAEGEILMEGKPVSIRSPRDAAALGIGMVYQHFMLVNEFTVWENIFFGIEKTGPLGVLKKEEMIARAKELCEKFDMPLELSARCGDLSVSAAQKVEILKVLARGCRILILDEPTAVLTPQETEQLFKQLSLLKAEGYTILIITHKLAEIKQLCDRITVMRGGRTVGTCRVSDISEEEMSRMMVGRDITLKVEKTAARPGETVLEVKDLTIPGKGKKPAVSHISFKAHRGEILCIAGVEGNGQRETVRALTGALRYKGQVQFLDKDLSQTDRRGIRKLGMAYIPEDRMRTGCDLTASIHENLISLDYGKNARLGFLADKELKQRSRAQIEKYAIKGSPEQSIGMLSGGNMQKVVVARELDADPQLIIADQPTRGIDIGAIENIHRQLVAMRDAGKAILLISADMAEVFALADRILVFHDGEITAEIEDVEACDEMQLGRYMLGLERKVAER